MRQKIQFIILFAMFYIVHLSYGQTIQWQKTVGGIDNDNARCVQITPDGGYIMIGQTNSNDGDISGNHGLYDIWVVKLSVTGLIQWQKVLGGTANDYGYSIQCTTDGGYILVGNTNSNDGDVSSNHGLSDIWVIKLTATGLIQWQKTLGGSEDDIFGYIQIASDGGYILLASTYSSDGDIWTHYGYADIWVVKLSSSGNIQWQQIFGGSSNDFSSSISMTQDGGYIISANTSSFDGDMNINYGLFDIWVAKINAFGSLQWQKTLGGSQSDFVTEIKSTVDEGVVIIGETFSNDGNITGNHGQSDVWVLKISATGLMQWQKTLGGTLNDRGTNIEILSSGDYLLTSFSSSTNGDVTGNHGQSDIWFVKISSIGTILWQKSFGGSLDEIGGMTKLTSDGGCIFVGSSASGNGDLTTNHGGEDAWIMKLEDIETIILFPNQLSNITEYPNPIMTGNLYVNYTLKHPTVVEIIIWDMFGNVISNYYTKNEEVGECKKIIEVDELKSGVYFLNLRTNSDSYTIKIIKE